MREVIDEDGTTWRCAQAYTDLAKGEERDEAARVDGTEDRYHVVCTPSGGGHPVRLQLPADWESACSDSALLEAIREEEGAS